MGLLPNFCESPCLSAKLSQLLAIAGIADDRMRATLDRVLEVDQ
jgi:hypothetical protein